MKYNALLLLFFSFLSYANIYNVSMPISLQNYELGFVQIALQDFEVISINKEELLKVTHSYLNEETIKEINKLSGNSVSIDALSALGMDVTFDYSKAMLFLKLSDKSSILHNLEFNNLVTPLPSSSGTFSMLNNFTIQAEHSNDETEFETEWLINANIGGHNGINFTSSIFYDYTSNGESKIYRGESVFFYDNYKWPFKFLLGDISTFNQGHINSKRLGGIQIKRAYQELQPLNKLIAQSNQEFYLPRSAEISIIINGIMISQLRLPSGRYNLSDLPLTGGENDIRINAVYNDGSEQSFYFSNFYNPRLLKKGISDFAVSIGLESENTDRRFKYSSKPSLYGFYEYGLSNQFTAGMNFEASDTTKIIGATSILNSSFGNLAIRVSAGDFINKRGVAFSLDTEHVVWGKSPFGAANLRLGYELKKNFNENSLVNAQQVQVSYANYQFFFNQNTNLNFSYTHRDNDIEPAYKMFSAGLNYRYDNFNISGEYRATQNSQLTDDEHQFIINFNWDYYNYFNQNQSQIAYSGLTKNSSISYNRINRNYVNDFGYRFRADHNESATTYNAQGSYTGRFFRTALSYEQVETSNTPTQQSYRANISSSLGIIDGKFGMGKGITAPFALVQSHKTLNNINVLINPSIDDGPEALTKGGIGALVELNTPFTQSQVNIDVPDAPIGYDIGRNLYEITPGTQTGHMILVGSQNFHTIIGNVLDQKNQPIALQRGELRQGDKKWSIFTNRTGRFVVEGVPSGDFIIQFKQLSALITIAKDQSSLFRSGNIKLMGDSK